MNNERLADVYEALEKMNKWRPVYQALLRTCKTKIEAMQALLYLIKIEKEI